MPRDVRREHGRRGGTGAGKHRRWRGKTVEEDGDDYVEEHDGDDDVVRDEEEHRQQGGADVFILAVHLVPDHGAHHRLHPAVARRHLEQREELPARPACHLACRRGKERAPAAGCSMAAQRGQGRGGR